jgi:AcrR family transcriptional regulator
MSAPVKPTRREERRIQTVREIKQLAREQIREGGPDAVSLSGIVRQMSMSPAALYRYFANRDALVADLVVDAYNELADSLVELERQDVSAERHLDEVLHGTRTWALRNPQAYQLIFQSRAGSGEGFAADRTIPAASRSMAVLVDALAAVTGGNARETEPRPSHAPVARDESFRAWAQRSGLSRFSTEVLALAFLTWTRLHGIISLEVGGHLAATGIGAEMLFESEVATIHQQARELPRAAPEPATD